LRAGGLRAAVAAVVVAIAAIGYVGWRRVSRPPAASRPGTAAALPGEPMTIVLAAPTRGGGAERLLPAGRSVRLAIALPFGAPAGRYRARLERVEGSVSVAVEQELGPARAGDDGLLTFDLRVPDAPGRRRLLVFAVEGSAAAEPAEAIAIYSCIVAAEAPAPPHRDR
ncbi:MAG TPA: hypothetical protein VMQ62_09135, partial [Dongiaceae bacterium]|nr:hypothetical protein [Dongiaceae bacterium]